ncbi:hypothetical protein M9434_001935 [Picochlorum sp. BPE23]|nr:hypothetical protein M9434_001935 [Picochlorum sp. BPE23]
MEGGIYSRQGSKNFEKSEHKYEEGPRDPILSPPSPEKCEQRLSLEPENDHAEEECLWAGPSRWIDLPREVMDIILGHLGSDDVQMARLVCREWNEAISHTMTSLKPRTLDLVAIEHGFLGAFPNVHCIDLTRCASMLSDESLSTGLFHMKHLEKLNLQGAENITDEFVQMLGSLKKLKWLSLQHCVKITDKGILSFCGHGRMEESSPPLLEYLDLSGIPLLTEISTCAVSEHLTSLKELRLGGYSRTVSVGDDMLQPLTICQRLQGLDISGCITVRNLSILTHLRHLKYLNLWNCMRLDSSSLSCLSSMKLGLVELSLRGCHGIDDDIFPYIATLRCLESLDLRSCEHIRGTQIECLSELRQLRNLNMRGCCGLVDLTGMGKLESVCCLDLSACWQLNNDSLKHLHSLSRITELKLNGCRNIHNADGVGIQGLSGMKNMKTLSLRNCEGLNKGALQSLSSLGELKTLDISGCSKIPPEDLRHIMHLKLTRLVASHLNWTGCSALQSLNATLEDLILSSCPNLVGTSFAPLKRLQGLKTLILNGCSNIPLFDRGLQSLGANIATLSLQNCCTMTDKGLASLSKLHRLESIDLSDCYDIHGDGFQQWSHMPRLHTVILGGCSSMKDDGIFHLVSQNPTITTLNLKQCRRISDKSVTYIASYLPKIRVLSFQASMGITDQGIRTIARGMRESLSHLSVQFCWQFGDESAIELASMPWLKHLDLLFSWKITDRTLQAFAASTSLVDINIFGCHRISSAAKQAISHKLSPILSHLCFRGPRRHIPNIPCSVSPTGAFECLISCCIGCFYCVWGFRYLQHECRSEYGR